MIAIANLDTVSKNYLLVAVIMTFGLTEQADTQFKLKIRLNDLENLIVT